MVIIFRDILILVIILIYVAIKYETADCYADYIASYVYIALMLTV